MSEFWSLKELYSSFDGEDFKKDVNLLDNVIEKYKDWVDKITKDNSNAEHKLEEYIKLETELKQTASKLYDFAELSYSVDTKNESASKNSEIIQVKLSTLAQWESKIQRWIGNLEDIDSIIQSSEVLKEHSFFIKDIVEGSKYLLSDNEEAIIAKMRNTGSSAWSKLKDTLTAGLLVDIEIDGEKKQLPLSVIRNMAYENDRGLRKKAYEAELASYKKIEDSVAACLNGIKGEVITISQMRGFKSPLEETLFDSRMDEETLNAMFIAMKESFPAFRKYLRRKGQLLGCNNGLPFYDLFAPIGELDKKYAYEEAQKIVEDNFRTFSDKLADFVRKAVDKNWIDVYPREGKVGGAFCENIHAVGESRVMLNYGENFTDIVTMAHELGHAYHGDCLMKESILNSDYPMPIAETASTFCETIIKKAAIKAADSETAFSILEMEISDCTQVIVDIYSRFLFESEVFNRRAHSSMTSTELQDIMIWAQKEAYGDGLDSQYLHSYMWACKPHYYYASTNFYNFPYAFGLLFAKGLYAEYIKRGEAFVKDYDMLLSITGKNKITDVTKLMGIDVHSVDFWRNSLKTIEEDIEEFIRLSEKK